MADPKRQAEFEAFTKRLEERLRALREFEMNRANRDDETIRRLDVMIADVDDLAPPDAENEGPAFGG